MIKLRKVNYNYLIDILTYFSVLVLGITMVALSFGRVNNQVFFVMTFFYILSIILLVSYFACRRDKNNYEKLFLSLASAIMTGTLFFLTNVKSMICLGICLFVFITLVVIVKSINIFGYYKNRRLKCEVKSIVTLFIVLAGIISGYILTNQLFFQLIIFGYFFIVFGLLSLFEPIILILLEQEKITKKK